MQKKMVLFVGSVLALVLWQMTQLNPSLALAQSEVDVRINRIEELSQQWSRAEEDQEKIHFEAEKQRRALCNLGEVSFCKFSGDPVGIVVTAYNPEIGQTDGYPCIGAGLKDLCHLSKTERIVALSQDLVGRASWKKFTYGDYVYIKGYLPACTGVFRVEDTMNNRFTNRGDIFLMDRKDNFGKCQVATVQKLQYNDL